MEKIITFVKAAVNIHPVMEKLKSGEIIRNILSVFHRLLAAILGFVVVVVWFKLWPIIGNLGFMGKLAFLVWQIAFPYASFLALKVLYIRAGEIMEYPDSDYVVVPVVAMLMKTKGQMCLIFFGALSVPVMLMVWFAGGDMFSMEDVFVNGILAFILAWVIGFMSLIAAQFCAEWTLAVFSIANDMSLLRRNAVPDKATDAA